eukprot:10597294-Lingulodinium_polyedra.AAC.1
MPGHGFSVDDCPCDPLTHIRRNDAEAVPDAGHADPRLSHEILVRAVLVERPLEGIGEIMTSTGSDEDDRQGGKFVAVCPWALEQPVEASGLASQLVDAAT